MEKINALQAKETLKLSDNELSGLDLGYLRGMLEDLQRQNQKLKAMLDHQQKVTAQQQNQITQLNADVNKLKVEFTRAQNNANEAQRTKNEALGQLVGGNNHQFGLFSAKVR